MQCCILEVIMKIPICLYIYVYFVFTPIRFILNLQHIYKLTHTAYFERHWKRCKKYYDTLPIFNIHTGFALTLFELGSVGKQITVHIIYRVWEWNVLLCHAVFLDSMFPYQTNLSNWKQSPKYILWINQFEGFMTNPFVL